jgi:hypothetical protein
MVLAVSRGLWSERNLGTILAAQHGLNAWRKDVAGVVPTGIIAMDFSVEFLTIFAFTFFILQCNIWLVEWNTGKIKPWWHRWSRRMIDWLLAVKWMVWRLLVSQRIACAKTNFMSIGDCFVQPTDNIAFHEREENNEMLKTMQSIRSISRSGTWVKVKSGTEDVTSEKPFFRWLTYTGTLNFNHVSLYVLTVQNRGGEMFLIFTRQPNTQSTLTMIPFSAARCMLEKLAHLIILDRYEGVTPVCDPCLLWPCALVSGIVPPLACRL